MSFLIAYVVLSLIAMIWIARDEETSRVFHIFGNGFSYVWFESGQRWAYLFKYGWRLAVLCLLVVLNGVLSIQYYRENAWGFSPTAQLGFSLSMLACSLVPIPWIYGSSQLRWTRRLDSIIRRLDLFVNNDTDWSELESNLQPAAYNTLGCWTAWHPNTEAWQKSWLWNDLLPVMYIQNSSSRSALFTIDWKTFLAWKVSEEDLQVNGQLPVHGALDSTFRVKSKTVVNDLANWCLIKTEFIEAE